MNAGRPPSPQDGASRQGTDRGPEAQGAVQPYGNLSRFNTCRQILDAVGEEALAHIVDDFLVLLGTSAAVYERNGDYALGIFSSGWCRLLDLASYRLCNTEDPREALASGVWRCHESCWTESSRISIERGEPVDVECAGGIRLYAEPIWADGSVVGAINFGYGEPPRDPASLKILGERYGVLPEELRRAAFSHPWRPRDVVESAGRRLRSAARLIGTMVERHRAQQAVAESEERYRMLFELESDAIFVIENETGRILEANQAATQLYGYSRKELLEMSNTDLSAEPEDTRRVTNESPIAPEQIVRVPLRRHRKRNGTVFPVEITGRFFEWRGRGVHIAAVRDTTERVRAEEERRRLEEQMRHVQKLESLGVLAGGIAHDFNNLLMSILGNADLALLNLSPAHPARDNVRQIEAASVRAAELCRQMLAYSGKASFVLQKLDLAEVVREMGHILQVSISKKATLRYDFGADLAPIEGDASQIRQVVMNLITNASEALGEEAGAISVSTGQIDSDGTYVPSGFPGQDLPEGRYVFLEVVDTGCGMDESTRDRIFDPFFSTKFAGRGLGLAAVLGIVRGHRGAIEVRSEPGKGTTFRLLFPGVGGEARKRSEAAEVRSYWRGSGTVLLVDDEAGVRAVAEQMLQALGFLVAVASDGQEAVELFRESAGEVSCVLLDLTMPRLGGDEAFEEIRRIRGEVPIILSSGHSEQEVVHRFSGKRHSGFIQKPYTVAKLREALRRTLS